MVLFNFLASSSLYLENTRFMDALDDILLATESEAILFGIWNDLKQLVYDNPKAEAFEREYASYFRMTRSCVGKSRKCRGRLARCRMMRRLRD